MTKKAFVSSVKSLRRLREKSTVSQTLGPESQYTTLTE